MNMIKKIVSSAVAVALLLSIISVLGVSAAIPNNAVTMYMDVSEYTGTEGETFNLYVKWNGLTLAKTDNQNGLGISGYTAAVVLPEGFEVVVEDPTDPYDVYELTDNYAIYQQADGGKAVSYTAATRTFSWNVAFAANARKQYYPAQDAVLLTLPVTVKTVPAGSAEFKFDSTTSVEFVEYVAGSMEDKQFYKSVLNGTEDPTTVRQLTANGATVGKTEEKEITVKNEVVTEYTGEKTLIYVAKVLQKADASKKVVLTKNGEKQYSDRTLAQILGGVAATGSTLSGDVAIGVLTNDTTATFGFELVD